jgi:hypothetical protein
MAPAGSGRGSSGREDLPAAPGAATPPGGGPGRAGAGQPDGAQRNARSMPAGGPPSRGLGDLFGERETKREQPRRTGLIDPDEPDEGLRLLP